MATTSWTVSELVDALEPDLEFRVIRPFADDMQQCHHVLFDPSRSRRDKIAALNRWLAEFQPCLFGRMEAKQGRLAFCLLTENDLERSDQEIRAKIAQERLDWRRRALGGESHGFLIVVVSERIAMARPSPTLLDLASRLCDLYLGESPRDEILHDDLILEMHDSGRTEWRKWNVGVNYFSAQGDGRWWKDHRFPGGIAFSMNSVGHMARKRAEDALTRNPVLAQKANGIPREKLVYFALLNAMKTIGARIEGAGRGTWLAEHGAFGEDKEPPPFADRPRSFGDLAGYSENRYRGFYHTDHTIPSDYFDEGLWRIEDLRVRDDLYFTYLHSLADDDYLSMGLGELFEPAADSTVQERSEQ